MLALRLKSYFTKNIYVSSLFSVLSSGNDIAKMFIKNHKFELSFNLSLFRFLKAVVYYKLC